MYFKLPFYKLKWLLVALLLFGQNTSADELLVNQPNLTLSPDKCVALRQGKSCFAEIKFQWKAPVRGDYCIRNAEDKKLLRCWYNSTFGELDKEFNSVDSHQYELVELATGLTSEVVEMKVNWVYTNKQKKRRWRLF